MITSYVAIDLETTGIGAKKVPGQTQPWHPFSFPTLSRGPGLSQANTLHVLQLPWKTVWVPMGP